MENFFDVIKEKCRLVCEDIVSILIFYSLFHIDFKKSVICLLLIQSLFPTFEDNYISMRGRFKRKVVFLILSLIEFIIAVILPFYLLDVPIIAVCSLYIIVTVVLMISEFIDGLLE